LHLTSAVQASLSPDLQALNWAGVQQAFLPKFENEAQDSSVAGAIVGGAASRYMVVSVKHSGSLLTLSRHGFAAKNSIQNEFTAGDRPAACLPAYLPASPPPSHHISTYA
jgi:hypothetical protein